MREAALEALVRQLEIAKVDVAREGPSLQVIDPAVPAEMPSRPRRLRLALIGFLLSGVAAFSIALVQAHRRQGPGGPGSKWHRLKQSWQ